MSYVPRSSFTPEASAIPMQVKKRRRVQVFSLLTTFLLVASLSGVGGVYAYTGYVKKQLESEKEKLGQINKSENNKKIEEIRIYNQRLNVAHSILDNHIAASKIFGLLEDATKQTVQFEKLEYAYDPGYEAQIKLSGKTREFESLALQKMQLLKNNTFDLLEISEINNTISAEDGTQGSQTAGTPVLEGVTFNVTGTFRKDDIEYSGNTMNPDIPTDAGVSVPMLNNATETTETVPAPGPAATSSTASGDVNTSAESQPVSIESNLSNQNSL